MNCCATLAAKFNSCNQLTFVRGDARQFKIVLFDPQSATPVDLTGAILSLNLPRDGGGTIKRTNGATTVLTAEVIVPMGGKGYVLLPDHGLVTGDPLTLATTGTLPAPLATATPYSVIVIDNDSFYFADPTTLAPIYLTDQGAGNFTFSNSNDLQLGTVLLGQFNLNLRAPVSLDTNAALAQSFQISWTNTASPPQTLVVLIQNLLDVYAQPTP